MDIQAVIFDRDNTLLYLEPSRVATLEERLRAIHPGLRFRDIFVLLEQWDGYLPPDPSLEGDLWGELVGRVGESLGLSSAQCALVASLLAPYYEYFVAFTDSNHAVQSLRALGYRLALLTNAPLPSVDETLLCAGIDPGEFVVRLSRAHLGVAKPDPEAFFRVATLMGVTPEQCLVVDDQSSHVTAARRCGMHALLLDRSSSADNVSAGVVSDLDGVIRALSNCTGLFPGDTD